MKSFAQTIAQDELNTKAVAIHGMWKMTLDRVQILEDAVIAFRQAQAEVNRDATALKLTEESLEDLMGKMAAADEAIQNAVEDHENAFFAQGEYADQIAPLLNDGEASAEGTCDCGCEQAEPMVFRFDLAA